MSPTDEQKKRMEEALERRFAAAKAELHQKQQPKRNKRERREGQGFDRSQKSRLMGSSLIMVDSPVKAQISSSTKKGNAGNSNQAQDVEESNQANAPLSHVVDEKLLKTNLKVNERRGGVVDNLLHELFQQGDSAHKYLQGSKSAKVGGWILLDNLVKRRPSSIMRGKDSNNVSERSKRHISMNQLKKAGSFDLPKEIQRYKTFLPMHEMWKDYIKQLLRPIGNAQLAQYLLDADLHGAIIIVVSCKMAVYNGVAGIMIQETAETFAIITADDKFLVVPKKLSLFIFQVDGWKVTLLGDKLTNRNVNS